MWQSGEIVCLLKDRDVFNVQLNKSLLLRHLLYHDVTVYKDFPLYHGKVFF